MTSTNQSNPFYMAGTEGSGRYVVVAVTSRGRVGYRNLGGSFRLRVEPNPNSEQGLSNLAPSFSGWKAGIGGNEYRFSCMPYGQEALVTKLGQALNVLTQGASDIQINPDAPDWARALVPTVPVPSTRPTVKAPPADTASDTKDALLAQARSLGVKGANSRWGIDALKRAIAAATPAQPAETPEQEHARLVDEARKAKLPGANLASRWTLATLRAKLA